MRLPISLVDILGEINALPGECQGGWVITAEVLTFGVRCRVDSTDRSCLTTLHEGTGAERAIVRKRVIRRLMVHRVSIGAVP